MDSAKKKSLIRLGVDFAQKMTQRNLSVYSASTAFFFLLSFLPILSTATALLPLVGIEEKYLVTVTTMVVPRAAEPLVVKIVNEAYERSGGVLSVSLILLLWFGAQGMLAMIRGLNGAYGMKEKRNYFFLRLVAMFYTFIMIIILIVMLAFLVFEGAISQLIPEHLQDQFFFLAFSLQLRLLLVFLAGVFLFALIYTYVPGGKRRYFAQIPGAIFTTVAWGIFSLGFSVYVNNFGHYSLYYGSLSAVMIFLIWLYCCMYITMIGGYINSYLMYRGLRIHFRRKKGTQEQPGGE